MARISDDIVQRLRRRLGSHLEDVAATGGAGAMTARILTFQPPQGRVEPEAEEPADVVDLSGARSQRRRARTVSGIFVYAARL